MRRGQIVECPPVSGPSRETMGRRGLPPRNGGPEGPPIPRLMGAEGYVNFSISIPSSSIRVYS